jgi:hypothetical protein
MDPPALWSLRGDSQEPDERRTQILLGALLLTISLGGLALLLVLFA